MKKYTHIKNKTKELWNYQGTEDLSNSEIMGWGLKKFTPTPKNVYTECNAIQNQNSSQNPNEDLLLECDRL